MKLVVSLLKEEEIPGMHMHREKVMWGQSLRHPSTSQGEKPPEKLNSVTSWFETSVSRTVRIAISVI